jgi:hypothetical protein
MTGAPAKPPASTEPQELVALEQLIERFGPWVRAERLTQVGGSASLPVWGLVLGADDRSLPTFAMVGGVHGIERIGTQVVLAYLTTLASLLEWDGMLRAGLERVRIACVPIVNPVGLQRGQRANGNGVDLMRNAPGIPDEPPLPPPTPWVGGQAFSSRLPWFRGWPEHGMELESAALCEFVRREVCGARASILVDVHSGFGARDRLWFPWARTRRPIPHLAEMRALSQLVDRTLPHHVYAIEPQSLSYTARGDLWDYLYDEQLRERPAQPFLPLTLELGSWAWIRKNPWQAVAPAGWFDPVRPHRLRRTLRRHLALFDVLLRAAATPEAWTFVDAHHRASVARDAFAAWYGR